MVNIYFVEKFIEVPSLNKEIHGTVIREIQYESKKVAPPLKLLAIFSVVVNLCN